MDERVALDPDPLGEESVDDGADEARAAAAALPAVVAVVVTHNPGPWFEEALEALASQEYPNLSILVIDNAGDVDPTPRIAAVAPRAYVRRLETNNGVGAAVNTALGMVEGAPFFLVCHDDVALASNAVRLLVEEAYRSNAAVVGPKVVRWDQVDALLTTGMGADRFGAPFPLCERGELDQEQHDAVRDVFFVPDSCFLVRADLLRALGGFDEEITFHGEDTDLCWRAHLVGARVLVVPSARARHVEALGERRPDDRRRLQLRHRLRMVCTNYGWFYLVGELVQQAVLSMLELVAVLLVGRFAHARDVAGAWTWNLRRTGSIVAKRRQVKQQRQITDLELRRLQSRGSARLTGFVRGQVGDHEATASLGDAVRQWLANRGAATQPQNVLLALAVALVLLFGSRHLITRGVPAIGEFVPFPDRAADLLRTSWGGWVAAGLGDAGPGATGLWLTGLAGVVVMGATGLLRTVLILGFVPFGLVGLWRLGSFTPHSRAKGAMLLAYAANPLLYNALAGGRWSALALYGVLPWLVRAMAELGGTEPYGPTTRRSLVHATAVIALGVAAVVSLSPVAALVVLLVAVAFGLGSLVMGAGRSLPRLAAGTVVGVVAGLALHAPWLISSWKGDDPDVHSLGGIGGAAEHRLWELLHFYSGRLGGAWVTWGLLVAGFAGLAIGRSWRLGWAVRGWCLYVLPLAVVAVVQAGWVDVALPPAEVLLAPASLGIAVAVGAGMAAFDLDLRGYRFGWRQFASVLAAGALLLAVLPIVLISIDGRWKMPRGGYDRVLRFVGTEPATTGPFRVLWLGAQDVLPVAGWPLGDGVSSYATTVGYPTLDAVWTGPLTDATQVIPEVLDTARRGGDNRLGQTLGLLAVRYVVVVDRLAPTPFVSNERPAPPWIDATLSSQLDLAPVDLNAAIRVYRNTAWQPMTVLVPADATRAADLSFSDGAAPAAAALQAIGPRRFEGELSGGDVVQLAESFDPRWNLEVDGSSVASGEGIGFTNRYEVTSSGTATLHFASPVTGRLLWVLQAMGWLGLAVVAVRTSARLARRRGAAAAPEAATALVAASPSPPPVPASPRIVTAVQVVTADPGVDEPAVTDPAVVYPGAAQPGIGASKAVDVADGAGQDCAGQDCAGQDCAGAEEGQR